MPEENKEKTFNMEVSCDLPTEHIVIRMTEPVDLVALSFPEAVAISSLILSNAMDVWNNAILPKRNKAMHAEMLQTAADLKEKIKNQTGQSPLEEMREQEAPPHVGIPPAGGL